MGRRALPPPPGGWEKAIGDAIQRLKEERPLNPQLLRQAKLGTILRNLRAEVGSAAVSFSKETLDKRLLRDLGGELAHRPKPPADPALSWMSKH